MQSSVSPSHRAKIPIKCPAQCPSGPSKYSGYRKSLLPPGEGQDEGIRIITHWLFSPPLTPPSPDGRGKKAGSFTASSVVTPCIDHLDRIHGHVCAPVWPPAVITYLFTCRIVYILRINNGIYPWLHSGQALERTGAFPAGVCPGTGTAGDQASRRVSLTGHIKKGTPAAGGPSMVFLLLK